MKMSLILSKVLKFIIRALVKEAASDLNKALKEEEKAVKLEDKVKTVREQATARTDKAAHVQDLANKLIGLAADVKPKASTKEGAE
ncbi:hypothetical protein [Vibrio cholerae]|uniref:Uncharacterized protein n=1 Tax=Vibrio cholerae TaxID=666 RepID=A0A655TDK4_VIBCL|nr:hypothetical protein [Vibrio cholerae]EEY49021.1 hypothetical protein VIG_001003 [Vibrio cholerae INDRE 91/1]AFC58315.1 hypothetical protein O3Y_07185 [Vibrio cholerae IEC224]AUR69727.1 hypothetical protein C1H56_06425 [Vibrio cholerae]AVL22695.1 hypothetical protein VCA1552_01272 [Vibrio cholerae]AWB74016.1 hypothetical protein A1552VC_01274 [Vibrio cholerae]